MSSDCAVSVAARPPLRSAEGRGADGGEAGGEPRREFRAGRDEASNFRVHHGQCKTASRGAAATPPAVRGSASGGGGGGVSLLGRTRVRREETSVVTVVRSCGIHGVTTAAGVGERSRGAGWSVAKRMCGTEEVSVLWWGEGWAAAGQGVQARGGSSRSKLGRCWAGWSAAGQGEQARGGLEAGY